MVQDHVDRRRQDRRLRRTATRAPRTTTTATSTWTTDGTCQLRRLPGNASCIITSPTALNDGQWHQVVGTLELGRPGALRRRQEGRTDAGTTTTAQDYRGYWRIGGDNVVERRYRTSPARSTTSSVYPTALTPTQVDAQCVAAGRTSQAAASPDRRLRRAGLPGRPRGLYCRLDERLGPTVATDSSPIGTTGVVHRRRDAAARRAVAGTGHRRRRSTAQSGQVATTTSYDTPRSTLETWFKTTTTTGGKLIGFGTPADRHSRATTTATSTCRTTAAQFGIWTGQMNSRSPRAAYNDGAWHHVVATQASDGMKLYVDGALVGHEPDHRRRRLQRLLAHRRRHTWGSGSSATSPALDEAAVYACRPRRHDGRRSTTPRRRHKPNAAPVAAFTSATHRPRRRLRRLASADTDGTVASYAWDFGDGSARRPAVDPTHTYAAAGTYTVTLTVTDDAGSRRHLDQPTVTVRRRRVNVAPTASFTSTVDQPRRRGRRHGVDRLRRHRRVVRLGLR